MNQLRAELLKIQFDANDNRPLSGTDCVGSALYHPDVHVVTNVPTTHRARSDKSAELREHRGCFRGTGGRHVVHQRVPFRDHSTYIVVQPESESTLRHEDHRRSPVRTRLWQSLVRDLSFRSALSSLRSEALILS